jgi:hypothetical protein
MMEAAFMMASDRVRLCTQYTARGVRPWNPAPGAAVSIHVCAGYALSRVV